MGFKSLSISKYPCLCKTGSTVIILAISNSCQEAQKRKRSHEKICHTNADNFFIKLILIFNIFKIKKKWFLTFFISYSISYCQHLLFHETFSSLDFCDTTYSWFPPPPSFFFFFFWLLLLATATGSSFPMWTLISKAEVFPRLGHPYIQIITFAQITYKWIPQLKIFEDT